MKSSELSPGMVVAHKDGLVGQAALVLTIGGWVNTTKERWQKPNWVRKMGATGVVLHVMPYGLNRSVVEYFSPIIETVMSGGDITPFITSIARGQAIVSTWADYIAKDAAVRAQQQRDADRREDQRARWEALVKVQGPNGISNASYHNGMVTMPLADYEALLARSEGRADLAKWIQSLPLPDAEYAADVQDVISNQPPVPWDER